jgi:hypothetical protein
MAQYAKFFMDLNLRFAKNHKYGVLMFFFFGDILTAEFIRQ